MRETGKLKIRFSDDLVAIRRECWERFSYSEDARGLVKKRQLAGSNHPQGGRTVRVLGRSYEEHRIVWLMHFGEEPAGILDHINGDRRDNRIQNLRLVGISENAANRGPWRDNPTGVSGVRPCRNGFQVNSIVRGVRIRKQGFATVSEAESYLNTKLREVYGADAEHRIARNSSSPRSIPEFCSVPRDAWGITCGLI